MAISQLSSSAPASGRAGLAGLVERLDAACLGPSDRLHESVTQVLASGCALSLLTAEQRASADQGYARHVLHHDPCGRYTLVSLVWRPGQFSPVHGHYTWCGFVVVDGCLHESTYRLDADASASVVASAERRPGSTRFAYAGLEQIHRLGNGSDHVAISVHAYGIDAPRVATHVNRLVPSAAA